MTRLLALLLLAATAALPVAAQAQGRFEPRLYVNGQAITGYELDQRAQMLKLFNAGGDPQSEALKALIDDRLRTQAAKGLEIAVTDAQIRAGMEEFAGRANLDAEKFIAALAQNGVEEETFRDFVTAGLVWREVVRDKFADKTEITSVQVDRALQRMDVALDTRLEISEIVIPIRPGQEAVAVAKARAIAARIRSPADFAAAARESSSAPSRGQGGSLGAVAPADLPETVRTRLRALQPGQVTAPTIIDGTVRLYLLRGVQEKPGARANGMKIDYAEYLLPGDLSGPSEAAKIRARVDRCDDLYGLAKGLRADRLVRKSVPEASLPREVADRIRPLDPGESTDFQRGSVRVFLMLCARVPNLSPEPDRDATRAQLLNQRLAEASETYLEKLRSDALIVQP